MTKRVAILISGGGSNMVALVRDMRGDHPARPALVLSNNPTARGLIKAGSMGVATAAIDHRPFGNDRAAFENELTQTLVNARPDFICLAGFMRILTLDFIQRWHGKLLNIHPSLLPKYKGLNTHARAINAGDTEAGCSVHEVTAELDGGPVLGQARVPIEDGETPESLQAKILRMEHVLYPSVLRRYCVGNRDVVRL